MNPETRNPIFIRALAKSMHSTAGILHKGGAPLAATNALFTASKELEKWAERIEKQHENNKGNVLNLDRYR